MLPYEDSKLFWHGTKIVTTADGLFAECLGHSAKPLLHSAKALPSAALSKEQSAKNPSAKVSLPSATYRALGKAFAECHVSTRQKKIRRQLWRPLCRVPPQRHSAKNFFFENSLPSAILLHSAKKFFLFLKKISLSSAMALALGKAGKLGLCFPALPSAMVTALGKALFAECGTRQRGEKCYFLVFCFPSAQTKKSHIYQHTAQDISHTHPYSITYTSITHHIHIHHP